MTEPSLPNIGSVPIDPRAEGQQPAPEGLTGRQEADFFDQGRRHYDYLAHQLNLGWVGKFLGGTSVPSNVAGLIALLMSLTFIGTLFMVATPEIVEARKVLVGLVSSSLAFLFGAATKGNDK